MKPNGVYPPSSGIRSNDTQGGFQGQTIHYINYKRL